MPLRCETITDNCLINPQKLCVLREVMEINCPIKIIPSTLTPEVGFNFLKPEGEAEAEAEAEAKDVYSYCCQANSSK